MKILFIIVILANIALFFWGYRSGAFESVKPQAENTLPEGKEKILLISEVDSSKPRQPNSTLPASQNQGGEGRARVIDDEKNTSLPGNTQDSSIDGSRP